MSLYIGLDIGGTKYLAASAYENLEIITKSQRPTPIPFQEGLEALHQMVAELAGDESIAGIGAAIGGPLDYQTGVVSPLHQPEWRDVPLKQIMEDKWRCPFHVEVDTNIAALAEYHVSGETAPRMMYMTVSTGIGGGYIVDGRIYRGMDGAHPEIGHQCLNYRCSNPSGISCECGASDCLEGLASGNGIRRVYGKPAEQLSEDEWAEVEFNLGQALRNIATIYLPDVMVLGGGVACGRGERLIEAVKKVMADGLKLVPIPEVRLSNLGYDTALLGSLVAARDGVGE